MENMNYETIDGVKCFAPELAKQNDDYPKEAFAILFEMETTNFWFTSRNNIIQKLVEKYVTSSSAKLLEIGCGTGFVLKNLKEKVKNLDLYGSEIYLEGISFARKRNPELTFYQLDAINMPFEKEFEAIGAFDVLEHIEEDEAALKGIYKALKKDGFLFISVPQHKFMWSITDEIAFHKRRYSRNELVKKIENQGFKVEYISSFVFTLFPFMMLSRLIKGKNNQQINKETIINEVKNLKVGNFTNQIFSFFMKIDEYLIGKGFSLPFGGSLFLVAKK